MNYNIRQIKSPCRTKYDIEYYKKRLFIKNKIINRFKLVVIVETFIILNLFMRLCNYKKYQ